MVNIEEHPFEKKHNERFYFNEFFGMSKYSVANYIKNESNNKFKIKPANTINTKYPGIIKINIKGNNYGTIGANDFRKKSKLFYDAVNLASKNIDFKKIDINNDKELIQPAYDLSNKNLLRELEIAVIVSGKVNSPTSTEPNKIQIWANNERHVGNFNNYYVSTRGIYTSEKIENYETSAPILSHELLHNLDAKDMYLDKKSIGIWSIMCFHNVVNKNTKKITQAPLDPMHKLYFGWTKPIKIIPTNKPTKIKYKKDKTPYFVDPNNKNIIYVLDYRNFNNKYQNKFKTYGIKNDRLLIWKINKKIAINDWKGKLSKTENGTYLRDSFVNSDGEGTAMKIININSNGTPIGNKININNIKIEVKNKKIIIKKF